MRQHRIAITLVELLVVIAIIGVVVALCLPAVRSAREPARRNSCTNNLKQIMLALLEYESQNGTLPPAYTVDTEGNRLHSWRTLILPHMEQRQLYESIDLSKPWDDPANAKARNAVVESYICPSYPDTKNLTTYLGVYGPDCVYSGSVPRSLSEITDGVETTIAVVDVGPDQAIHWMSPQDISEKEVRKFDAERRTNHPGIMQAAFLDGHVTAIYLDVDKDILGALLTSSCFPNQNIVKFVWRAGFGVARKRRIVILLKTERIKEPFYPRRSGRCV